MEYLLHLAVFILIYSLAALALDLILGWGGMLNLSQPVFMGIGAYGLALSLRTYDLSLIGGVAIGLGAACLISLFIGYILSRLKSEYYALASLGLMVMFTGVAMNLKEITRGPLGIGGISRFSLGLENISSQLQFFIILIAVFLLILILLRTIYKAPFGRILAAARDDEISLKHLGYPIHKFRMFAFVLASMISALAGIFLASYLGFINPTLFALTDAVFLFAIVVIGGLGSIGGAVAGACVLFLIPELLRFIGLPDETASQIRAMIYGLCMILVPLVLPRGLYGRFKL